MLYCCCLVTKSCLTLLWPQPARLLHPWDFSGKNTGVGCYFLLQGIFLTQGLNPGLLHCRQTLPFESLVSTISKMNQPYICIYFLTCGLSSHSSHHSALRKVPCTTQCVLISCYFIHSIDRVYMSIPSSQFLPPPAFPLVNHIFVLCLCPYFCFANRIIYTIFLDPTYMH